jgi:hypothetical protein
MSQSGKDGMTALFIQSAARVIHSEILPKISEKLSCDACEYEAEHIPMAQRRDHSCLFPHDPTVTDVDEKLVESLGYLKDHEDEIFRGMVLEMQEDPLSAQDVMEWIRDRPFITIARDLKKLRHQVLKIILEDETIEELKPEEVVY